VDHFLADGFARQPLINGLLPAWLWLHLPV
jgi:hypothetical protein